MANEGSDSSGTVILRLCANHMMKMVCRRIASMDFPKKVVIFLFCNNGFFDKMLFKVGQICKKIIGLMLGTTTFIGVSNLFSMAVKIFCSENFNNEVQQCVDFTFNKQNVGFTSIFKKILYHV